MRRLLPFLLLWPLLAWGQGENVMMLSTGIHDMELSEGVLYYFYDPGGLSNYPNECDVRYNLHAEAGLPIHIEGRVHTQDRYDYLVLRDGADDTVGHRYEGLDRVETTCLSGTAVMEFVSDDRINYPGFCLRVWVECQTPPEVTDISVLGTTGRTASLAWSDRSGATGWTVLYGTEPERLVFRSTTSSTGITLTGLGSEQLYYFRVYNNHGDSEERTACIALNSFTTVCDGITEIVHDVGQGDVEISATTAPCVHHVLTGTSHGEHTVLVRSGFHGTIVLRGLHMDETNTFPLHTDSHIRIEGRANATNLEPVTVVNIILDGDNTLLRQHGGGACIQVDVGATAHFEAVDPTDNYSGTLCAVQQHYYGGAAIGALCRSETTEESVSTWNGALTAGGNVVIGSGVYYTRGGHAAGIGGGHRSYYDAMILIYGGIVHSSCIYHAAGIGSGCPSAHGVMETNPPFSSVVVLPPTIIEAEGADVNQVSQPSLGVAGATTIFYLGDPNKPALTLSTADLLPQARIYADLSDDASMRRVLNLLGPDLDVHRLFLGATDASGRLTIHALLPERTLFFTDALSPQGTPYEPVLVEGMPPGGAVALPLSASGLSLTHSPGPDLLQGFSSREATDSASTLTLICQEELRELSFSLVSSNMMGPFSFFLNNTPLPSAPTSLSPGELLTVRCPLRTGAAPGLHSNQLRVTGLAGLDSLDFRQSLSQYVVRLTTLRSCHPDSLSLTLPNGLIVLSDTLVRDTIPVAVHPSGNQYLSCNGTTLSGDASFPQLHDSILAYRALFHPLLTDTMDRSCCDSLVLESGTYTLSGCYDALLHTFDGCDSLVTLSLTVHPSFLLDTTLRLCPDQLPLAFGPFSFTPESDSGTYLSTLHTLHGCDSAFSVQLLLGQLDTTLFSLTLPDTALPYPYADTLFLPGTESGLYTFLSQNRFGCDSLTLLYLTILPSPPPPDTLPALWVPNACIPGLPFQAKGWGIETFEIDIFDRLGRPVWHSEDIDTPWDGGSLPQGTYVYLIHYTLSIRPNEPLTRKGTITLIR